MGNNLTNFCIDSRKNRSVSIIGNFNSNEIEKAMSGKIGSGKKKDTSKLHKKEITNKAGKKQSVWVKGDVVKINNPGNRSHGKVGEVHEDEGGGQSVKHVHEGKTIDYKLKTGNTIDHASDDEKKKYHSDMATHHTGNDYDKEKRQHHLDKYDEMMSSKNEGKNEGETDSKYKKHIDKKNGKHDDDPDDNLVSIKDDMLDEDFEWAINLSKDDIKKEYKNLDDKEVNKLFSLLQDEKKTMKEHNDKSNKEDKSSDKKDSKKKEEDDPESSQETSWKVGEDYEGYGVVEKIKNVSSDTSIISFDNGSKIQFNIDRWGNWTEDKIIEQPKKKDKSDNKEKSVQYIVNADEEINKAEDILVNVELIGDEGNIIKAILINPSEDINKAGGNLHQETHTDKKGHTVKKWVKNNDGDGPGGYYKNVKSNLSKEDAEKFRKKKEVTGDTYDDYEKKLGKILSSDEAKHIDKYHGRISQDAIIRKFKRDRETETNRINEHIKKTRESKQSEKSE